MTALVELLTSPLLGAVSDEIGRRPILILSQFGELAALLIIARFHDFYAGYVVAYLRTLHYSVSLISYFNAQAMLVNRPLEIHVETDTAFLLPLPSTTYIMLLWCQ
jgi:MFS family permease